MRLNLLFTCLVFVGCASSAALAIATHDSKTVKTYHQAMSWTQCLSKLQSVKKHPPAGYKVVDFTVLKSERSALLDMYNERASMDIMLLCAGGEFVYTLSKLIPLQ